MKFKVEKGTPLFDKLKDLGERMKAANKEAFSLCTEMGFKQMRPAPHALAGGISSFYSKTKPTNFVCTVNAKSPNDFFPKRRVNANKELLARIDKLPVIDYNELNKLINYDGWNSDKFNERGGRYVSMHPGISWHKDHVLLDVAEYVKYKPVKGMVEITVSEYNKIKDKK